MKGDLDILAEVMLFLLGIITGSMITYLVDKDRYANKVLNHTYTISTNTITEITVDWSK